MLRSPSVEGEGVGTITSASFTHRALIGMAGKRRKQPPFSPFSKGDLRVNEMC